MSLLTFIWESRWRQLYDKVSHLVLLNDTNVVLNELEGLNCLNEVLLVEVLLCVHPFSRRCVSLWHLCHELIESIALVGFILALSLRLVVAAGQQLLALLSRSTWLIVISLINSRPADGLDAAGRYRKVPELAGIFKAFPARITKYGNTYTKPTKSARKTVRIAPP